MESKLLHLKNELKLLLKTPLNCDEGTRLEPISCKLYSLWEQIRSKYALDLMPTATTIDEKIRILTSFRDEDSVIRTMCEGDDAVNSEYSETIETINELNKGSGIEEFDNWLGEVSIEIDLELIQTVEEAEKELDEIKSYYERAKSEFFEYASIFE